MGGVFFLTDNLNSKCRRKHNINMVALFTSLMAQWQSLLFSYSNDAIHSTRRPFFLSNEYFQDVIKSFTILIQWPHFFDLANKHCKNQVYNILTSLLKGPLLDCFFSFFFLLKRRRRRMRNHLTFIIFIKRIKKDRITLRHVKKKHGYLNVLLYLNHSKHLLNKFMFWQ